MAIFASVRRRAWASRYFWTTGCSELKMKKNHRRPQGVNILSGSYQQGARTPKSCVLSDSSGGGRQIRVVIDDDRTAGSRGIKSPALGVGGARLRDHIA